MKMMTRLIALLFTAMLALSACQEQGPFEDAGEQIDEAAEDVGNAAEDACEDIKEGMGADDKDC